MHYRAVATALISLAAVVPVEPPSPPSPPDHVVIRSAPAAAEPAVDEQAVAAALASLDASFQRYATDHFILLSDADAVWTHRQTRLLERTHHEFARSMARLGLELSAPPHKLLCILIKNRAQYLAFARAQDRVRRQWIAGYFSPRSNRIVFYDDRTSPQRREIERQLAALDEQAVKAQALLEQAIAAAAPAQAIAQLAAQAERISALAVAERDRIEREGRIFSDAKAIHEAVHLLAFNLGVQKPGHAYPLWLSEGLALSFETDNPEHAFGPGRTEPPRRDAFIAARAAGQIIPLAALATMQAPPADDPATARLAYAQSDLLFRYLFRFQPAALAEFFRDMLKQTHGRGTAAQRLQLFEQHFGDADKLQQRWLEWIDAIDKKPRTQ